MGRGVFCRGVVVHRLVDVVNVDAVAENRPDVGGLKLDGRAGDADERRPDPVVSLLIQFVWCAERF